MNINIYLEDNLGKKITDNAKALGKTRNAIIREAIKEWLKYHKANQWPASVRRFKGITDFPDFEYYRNDLIKPKDDPFK
jgi:hypothetical protein